MTEREIVRYFAKAAKPRLMDLLKLKVRHVYELTPGSAGSSLVIEGSEVQFKLVKSSQPYKGIERFVAPDKVIDFVVNPGLLPIVKAILMDVRGRNALVTRRLASDDNDHRLEAQLDHFGIKVSMPADFVGKETQLVWECLYGVI